MSDTFIPNSLSGWEQVEFTTENTHIDLHHSCHTSHFIQNELILFFGEEFSQTTTTDAFYVYNIEKRTARKLKCRYNPLERRNHATCVVNDVVFLFGGDSWPLKNDLWMFQKLNGHYEWKYIDAHGKLPCGRRYHCIAYHDGFLYLFGGENNFLDRNSLHDF